MPPPSTSRRAFAHDRLELHVDALDGGSWQVLLAPKHEDIARLYVHARQIADEAHFTDRCMHGGS
jgi:hypothetical protein